MKKSEFLIYIFALAYLCAVCFFIPSGYPDFYKGNLKPVQINVCSGENSDELVACLKRKDVIYFDGIMKKLLVLTGADRKVQPGTYKIYPGSCFNVINQIKRARPEKLVVTIIPGRTLPDIAEHNNISLKALKKAIADNNNFPKEMHAILPQSVSARCMFLLPDTYFCAPNENAGEKLVQIASRHWLERVGRRLPAEMFNKETLCRCGILASVVEGEARKETEKTVLAAIFRKRLALSMRLQSCATVIFCWKEFRGVKKKKLSYDDLFIDSRYNTYRYGGLPPAPINIPSKGSWFAACDNKETEYLFFFASENGYHTFSKTYEEHIRKQKEAGK